MLIKQLTHSAILPAFSLLPPAMSSKAALVMVLAIALQESGAEHRRQIGGPARGYWQFERGGGIMGVLTHKATAEYAASVCAALDYPADTLAVYTAVEHNDILAATFARLNLWWLPQPLATNEADGWAQYIDAWRPGKPHRDTWSGHWKTATETGQEVAL